MASEFKPSYFLPAFKPRIKPRLGGKIGPEGISGIRIKPRILPTPVSGITGRVKAIRIPRANTGAVSGATSFTKPALANLTSGSHAGRPPAANPKPPSPSQQTGVSTRMSYRTPTKAPASLGAQRPGVHSIAGAQMKIRQANPLRVRNITGIPHLHI